MSHTTCFSPHLSASAVMVLTSLPCSAPLQVDGSETEAELAAINGMPADVVLLNIADGMSRVSGWVPVLHALLLRCMQ